MKLRPVLILSICLVVSAAAQTGAPPRSLPRIDSRAEFDRLARIYYQGRFYALPHLMFIIDRASRGRVYYVNSKRYSFHGEFANANYLTLERGREFFRRNYLEANRRFILGTIAYQRSFGINHSAVYPAVLVQEGVNAEAAGVLITTNPFDREDRGAVYVNAKRGLGIRVVEK